MKSMIPVLVLGVTLGSFSLGAEPAAVAGTWQMTIFSPEGSHKAEANLEQEGERLSGSLQTESGRIPIAGNVKGSDVEITFSVVYQQSDLPITLSGTVDGDSMRGRALFGTYGDGSWRAERND